MVYGAVVGADDQPSLVLPNGLSAVRRPAVVRDLVGDYLDRGWYVPAKDLGVAPRVVMPLHVVPKSGGRWRLIGDLSAGGDLSVNARARVAGALDPPAPVHKYTRVRDIRESLEARLRAGQRVRFTKVDVDSAYSRVAVSVPSIARQGMNVPGVGVVCSLRLLFGSGTSPRDFVSWSDAFVWVMRAHGVEVWNVVDDFLVVESSWGRVVAATTRLLSLLEASGFQVSRAKFEATGAPAWVAEFLGVVFDAYRGCYGLSAERRTAFAALLRSTVHSRRLPRRVAARVAGKMAWFGSVYPLSRAFASVWHAAAARAAELGSCRVTGAMRRAAAWFVHVVGVAPDIPIVRSALHPVELYTDASLYGFGGWWGSIWCSGRWGRNDLRLSRSNIMVLEMATLVFFVLALGERLRNQRVVVRCDNASVCGCLYTWRSRQPIVARLLRRLVAHLVSVNARLHVLWIGTHANYVADLLSRGSRVLWFPVAPGVPVHVSCALQLPITWRRRSAWWQPLPLCS